MLSFTFLKKYAFEILLGICLLFLLIYGIYCKIIGKKGSWSSKFTYCGMADSLVHPEYENTTPKDSKGERQCRHVLQTMFKKPFNKHRPDFLRNITGNNLELDCYNEELKLAVEYNGIQHEKYTPFFHKNKEAFLNQRYRDELKRRMCKEQGIYLIEVPSTIKLDKIEHYIMKELTAYINEKTQSN
jgi:hypothetical protein